jgi:ankyrin repeat protein
MVKRHWLPRRRVLVLPFTASVSAKEEVAMSNVTALHDAVKCGDLERLRALLDENSRLANARSETDPRGTYPLHVAAEFGQAAAARVLLEYGADVSLLDKENDSIALCWAAFFGRPEVVDVLLEAGSEPSQCNNHGLTPLGCAIGGSQGRWQQFSDATLADWQRAAEIIRARGGIE